jgi:hypothetical protein
MHQDRGIRPPSGVFNGPPADSTPSATISALSLLNKSARPAEAQAHRELVVFDWFNSPPRYI